MAMAILPQAADDVTIRPLGQKPTLFMDPPASGPEQPELPEPEAFIPPQPERMPVRTRMPRIDELPVPAQNEIRARRGELSEDHHPEKRRMTLLQRLAAVGLGRREDEDVVPAAPRTAPPLPPAAERLPGRPAARTDRGRSRSPNTPSARLHRVSTSTAGRRLCITVRKRISSTSRLSCGGRRTDESDQA